MSFFSHLFEGKLNKLSTDITHAPGSLARHPAEIAEVAGGAALAAAPFLAPELIGAIGAGDAAAGFGLGADAAAAGLPAVDALSFAPEVGSDAFLPAAGLAEDVGGGAGGAGGVTDEFLGTVAPAADSGAAASAVPQGVTSTAASEAGLPGVTASTPAGGNALSPASGAAGGSLTDKLGGALSSPWTKLALGAVPLGIALARGEPSIPPQAQAATEFSQQTISNANTLNPSQIAVINQQRQDSINQWRQVLFNQGVTVPEKDTRWAQINANVDAQMTASTQQMLQQNLQSALQANAQLLQVASIQMQNDQNFTNTLVNATKSLGSVAGGGINLKLA
jgi:hypothetical protein